jgi:CheY-like chemotaxis protein
MKKSILIIEDSKALNYVLSTIFKPSFNVILAKNNFDAFQVLRSNQIIDLILLDIPAEESDNFRFLSHLSSSSLFDDVPKVILSNSTNQELINKIKTFKACIFFTTPFNPVSLAEKVKQLIDDKENQRLTKETG